MFFLKSLRRYYHIIVTITLFLFEVIDWGFMRRRFILIITIIFNNNGFTILLYGSWNRKTNHTPSKPSIKHLRFSHARFKSFIVTYQIFPCYLMLLSLLDYLRIQITCWLSRVRLNNHFTSLSHFIFSLGLFKRVWSIKFLIFNY